MRAVWDKGVEQLIAVKKRAARDFAKGIISKAMLDKIVQSIEDLIALIQTGARGDKNEKE